MRDAQDRSLSHASPVGRRGFLKTVIGFGALAGLSVVRSNPSLAASFTHEERDKMTPDEVIALLREGNERFLAGKMRQHDYSAQRRASVADQYPAAAILSCIDSRVPPEIIFDAQVGDAFIARVAGNVSNDDVVGSLEFSCALEGSKLVLVMGHTSCGAIKGAIDGAQLGHLTGLLDKIKPAVAATKYDGARSSQNGAFVDAVVATNVRRTVEDIRQHSDVLTKLEKDGKVRIAGAVYSLSSGKVDFLA